MHTALLLSVMTVMWELSPTNVADLVILITCKSVIVIAQSTNWGGGLNTPLVNTFADL